MKDGKLIGCVRTVDFMRSGRWTKAATQAKALGVSLRTVFSYRKANYEARKLRGQSHHNYLSRLAHCDHILELEYSGWRGDVHELTKILGVREVTTFRELRFIEEAIGRRLNLVRRRRKRTTM